MFCQQVLEVNTALVLNAGYMDWKRAPRTREEMPLSPVTQGNTPGVTGGVNPGTTPQIIQISCNPPPSYHNINLPIGHPSILASDRGAPPSYEEAIDPNGIQTVELSL